MPNGNSAHHRTLVAIVQDHPGVMSRVVSMFRRRSFNIEEISVGPTETAGLSRITMVVDASTVEVDQVIKQLYKLVEVLKVVDLSDEPAVQRELALIKVSANAQNRAEIMQIVGIYEGRIVDLTRGTLIIEIARSVEKVESLIALLRPFGIKEIARTGRVSMARGSGAVYAARGEATA